MSVASDDFFDPRISFGRTILRDACIDAMGGRELDESPKLDSHPYLRHIRERKQQTPTSNLVFRIADDILADLHGWLLLLKMEFRRCQFTNIFATIARRTTSR